jgi:phosphoribosylanthranilate isomerase
MPSVKICGLQTADMVRSVASLPVDHIGFLFARSKRQVTVEQASELLRVLRETGKSGKPEAVGVFVNPAIEELQAIMTAAPLDIIQLHGQESPEFCRAVKEAFPGAKVLKVWSLAGQSESSLTKEQVSAQLEPFQPYIDGVLLDTLDPVYGGGSGKTFAWDTIPPYQAWCREAGIPLLVAGGLHPENVQDLLHTYGPDGVDVSSGVETDGTKDIHKIRSFVERVKANV